jgi:hypothetical protein
MLLLVIMIASIISTFFVFASLVYQPVDMHPIHISQTEINYDSKSKTIQIATKLYIDDFELGIKKAYNKNTLIYTPKEMKDADTWLHKYITTHLKVNINGTPIGFDFVGRETSENQLAVWVYLESAEISQPKQIMVDSRYLYEVYDDQKNMIDIKLDGRKKKFLMMEESKGAQTITL